MEMWKYVFGTRSTSSGVRYAKATVNNIAGVILLPDDWSTSYYTLNNTNTTDAAFTSNSISASDWASSLEAHGAVFLPAAGYRSGTTVDLVGGSGFYWSSTTYGTLWAYDVNFNSYDLRPQYYDYRYYGSSVRLVRAVE